jgi:serine/threonine-protein kinase
MAAVYVGRALGVAGFERLFAVKVLHPHLAHEQEFITMFLDEARLAARIRHPNVVPTIDISDTQDAGYYLVMDYIEGDHLGALLQKAYKLGTRLPAPIALRIVVDALEGLAAAHSLTDESGRRINLVHRDVSPHNIMVSTDGVARITDFGVAKAEVRLSTTRQGQFKGKLAYMAPEHASTGEADQRSDLFSVAIILWECLTGRRLFRAENQAATLNKICIEPIPMPSSVDPALAPFDPVLERALAREPELRYQSAEEFAEAIEERAETLGGLANQRSVAKLVREYAADKIERDRELIRSAIAEVSASGGSEPAPAASALETSAAPPPLASGPGGRAAPPIEIPAPAFTPGTRSAAPPPRRWPVLLLGTLVLVAAGLTLIALRKQEPTRISSSPLTPNEAPEPPAAQQPAEPQPSAATTPTPANDTTAASAHEHATASGTVAAGHAESVNQPQSEHTESTAEARPHPRHEGAAKHPAPPAPEKPVSTALPERPKRVAAKPEAPPDLMLNPYRTREQ